MNQDKETTPTPSKFSVYGLDVVFPREYVYPEIKDIMAQIKLSLDKEGPSVIESPPGIGRLEIIFSVYLAHMQQNPEFGPIVYATRSYGQYLEAFDAFKDVLAARNVYFPEEKISSISLGSKELQCPLYNQKMEEVHDEYLAKKKEGKNTSSIMRDIEDICFSMTNTNTSNKCKYFDANIEKYPLTNSIQKFNKWCEKCGCCPFWSARQIMTKFQVIFVSEEELFNPKTSKNILSRLPSTTAFIFDNAETIDNTCCKFMSAYITPSILDDAEKAINRIKKTCKDEEEVQRQIDGLKPGVKIDDIIKMAPLKALDEGGFITSPNFDIPIIECHRINSSICGTLWNLEYCAERISYLIRFFKGLIKSVKNQRDKSFTSTQLLTEIFESIYIEPLALYFLGPRISYYLSTTKRSDIGQYKALYALCDFCTILATYNDSISITFDTSDPILNGSETIMQLSCNDASIAFSEIMKVSNCFMISSSALCGIASYHIFLDFTPITQVAFPLLPRDDHQNYPIFGMIVTHGSGQNDMTVLTKNFNNTGLVRNINGMILEISKVTPDGMVCFFPSMEALLNFVKKWETTNQHEDLLKKKPIFIETYDPMMSSFILDDYYRAIDNGRGALLLCVAGGRIADAIDLRGRYGRSVLFLGYPMDEINSPAIIERANYLETSIHFPSSKFIKLNSIRKALAPLSRVLSSKSDYAAVFLVDKRYQNAEVIEAMIPQWLRNMFTKDTMGQSVINAKDEVERFFTKAHTCESPELKVKANDK